LGTAAAPASRSQRSSGLLFGADHTFQSENGQVLLGVLGGLSETTQNFTRSSSGQQWTDYNVDISRVWNSVPRGTTYDYQVLTNHALQNQETQTLKGGDLGLTAAVSRGGFFSDSLVKMDLLNLNRTPTTFDTFDSQLNVPYVNTRGCIFVGYRNRPPGVPAGSIDPTNVPSTSNPQTRTTVILQSTAQQNFIVADNIGYHFNLEWGYWIEPLVGFQYTYTTYGSNAADLGLIDGQALRLQGGARFGVTQLVSDTAFWTGSFTGLLYSDVVVRGFVTNSDGFSSGALLADQGKIRFQGILNSRLQFSNGVSIFLECQGRGGSDYWGVGGRIGGRYEF
jgi:hypothetical protein